MSVTSWESAIIPAPLETVWAIVRPLDFSYYSRVSNVEIEGKKPSDEVSNVRVVTYDDGTTQSLKLVGLSDAEYSISWDVISSEPAIGAMSVAHRVQLRRDTQANQTFIEWTCIFSSDASGEVVQDQKYKQLEHFEALARSVKAGKEAGQSDSKKAYRYYREDFGPLQTKPLHYEMVLDVTEEEVTVALNATYRYQGEGDLLELALDAKNLEVKSIELFSTASSLSTHGDGPYSSEVLVEHMDSFADPVDLAYKVDAESHKINVTLPKALSTGSEFVIRSVTICRPTENILEGIYYDYTPDGDYPRTMITQCQQYGFQRIVPCIDRMAAKMYYTTTITADKRYARIITNGDLAPGFFDEKTGAPVYKEAGPDRHTLTYYNHKVNMAPYLFFLGCGTYDTYRRWVEYPDGDKFLAEILVFPGLVQPKDACVALDALHDSILWTYISTGPEQYEHEEDRLAIYKLMDQREELKAKEAPLITSSATAATKSSVSAADQMAFMRQLASVRAELKQLIGKWTNTGYKYTGQIYREIGMQNSDYGGMENVGNTTILSSRLVPSPTLTDGSYLYMEGVKIHEYYHNINGSQVTGQSPFEIWLNEAVTVHVQRQREDVLFGHDFMRLQKVRYAMTPGTGPLAQDLMPTSMAIEPEGFNMTQELISAMTYSKAPEFVKMIERIITPPVFNRGLHLYYTKHAFANATTDDWISAMEEASGQNLTAMANQWLRRTGHPRVSYSGVYDADNKTYTVSMTQTGFESHPEGINGPWMFPVDWALIINGKVFREGIFVMTEASHTLVIDNVTEQPDYLSFARDWSFFGSVSSSVSPEELTSQALTDPDAVNRFLAYRQISSVVKANIIEALVEGKEGSLVIDQSWINLHLKILTDETITPSTRALMLGEAEEINSRPDLAHYYKEIALAKKAMIQAVWYEGHATILNLYDKLAAEKSPSFKVGIHVRALKHHCFGLMRHGSSTPVISPTADRQLPVVDVGARAKELLKNPFQSDKSFGFTSYLNLQQEDRQEFKQTIRAEWAKHPDATEHYIACVATVDCDSAAQDISDLLEDPLFNVNLAGHARTVCRAWGANRKRSLLTPDGLKLTVKMFLLVGKVNQMSAFSLYQAFSDIKKFDSTTMASLVAALEEMRDGLDKVEQQSLFNQVNLLLSRAAEE